MSSLDEKAQVDDISPVSSKVQLPDNQAPNSSEFNHPNLAALDNFQVLPKILEEGIIFVASGPGILLQAANQGSKTNTNSNLTNELTAALQSTVSYIACLVFGTQQEKAALLGRIRLGRPPFLLPSQTRTSPDAASQLWLVATIYASATDFYQRIYGVFDHRTAEAGYSEFSILLRHLTPTVLPQGSWPASRPEFWAYWDEQMANLSVSSEAKKFAGDLTQHTQLPRGVGYVKPFLRAITVEMLPERIRDEYGLQSTVTTRWLYSTTMGILKPVYPVLPKSWRSQPINYYLAELRKEINV